MSLIDASYFTGELDVPNTDQPAVLAALNDDIDTYEREILISLLGYSLYKQFTTAIEGSDPDQKWKDLRDGAEFSFNLGPHTIETKWEGLKNTAKRSLIAYYVYFKKVHIDMRSAAGVGGIIQTKTENSVIVSPDKVLLRTWNKMLELYGDVSDRYQPWAGCTFHKYSGPDMYTHFNDRPSAYNFLLARKADFPDWIFTPMDRLNSFGL